MSATGNFQGFWSYVHLDDRAEGGRIRRLATDLVDQFELLTGDTISLFVDRVAIGWGETWREAIDESLASVAFFIPIMTPRYFLSPECRHELRLFAEKASQLGVKELVLPLYYVTAPCLSREPAEDDLAALVKTFQWEDWRELRLADISSESYRRGVARLATRLVEANKKAESPIPSTAVEPDAVQPGDADDSPGLLDRLAKAEEAVPSLAHTLEEITTAIAAIGDIVQAGADDITRGDAQGKGFAARLVTSRKVAARLSAPAEEIWALSNKYASQLQDVDEGFRLIFELAPWEVRSNPASAPSARKFLEQVRGMSTASHEALQSIRRMVEATTPLEKASRDLRPPLRRLRQGLAVLMEAGATCDEWVSLIDAASAECMTGVQQATPEEWAAQSTRP